MSAKQYDMSWETARKTIDLIFQSPSDDIKIEYQGGEPLLNWDIVRESILYAKFVNKLAGKNLSFVICTNLMQITKEQIDFIKNIQLKSQHRLTGLNSCMIQIENLEYLKVHTTNSLKTLS